MIDEDFTLYVTVVYVALFRCLQEQYYPRLMILALSEKIRTVYDRLQYRYLSITKTD